MIERDQIKALVPHKGGMCLWDRVLEWDDARVLLQAASHADPGNPLRSGQRLRALHLCEYGAQAMAVHGGLRASRAAPGGAARPGVLVALRGVALHVARIDQLEGVIQCEATVLVESESSQQYAFRITHGAALLAEGRAAVMLHDAPPT